MVFDTTWMTSIEESATSLNPAVSTGSGGISGMNIMYIIVGIIGFLDNLLVVVVIGTSRSMKKRHTSWFLINQSVIDMLTAGLLVGHSYRPDIRVTSLARELYCKLWYTTHFLWVFAVASTYNLLMITLERYVAIVNPVWHKNHVTWKLRSIAMVIPYLIGNIWGLYVGLTADVVDEQCLPYNYKSKGVGLAIGIATFVIQFLIPLLIMFVCYIRIFLVFKGSHPVTGSDAAPSTEDESRSKARENILKTLITVCVAFILCWVWNQVFFLLFNLGVNVSMASPFYPFSVATVQSNCAINPLIYAAKYTEFRRAFVRLVRKGKVETSVKVSSGSTTTKSANTCTTNT